jgi:hypothetical protein
MAGAAPISEKSTITIGLAIVAAGLVATASATIVKVTDLRTVQEEQKKDIELLKEARHQQDLQIVSVVGDLKVVTRDLQTVTDELRRQRDDKDPVRSAGGRRPLQP